ncbi:hypothetical protein EJ04DRAFT_8389 [Polyplosphaeria fusca]|uniref:Secreted protein n=1 Tax=Polyplosphaeria fusca TaxID=682080 RepID=A0A9P4V5P8_9PLEO|nr:hypothetical protein EJ04DRAFT_8389 [Polyplosphaeria fusca]
MRIWSALLVYKICALKGTAARRCGGSSGPSFHHAVARSRVEFKARNNIWGPGYVSNVTLVDAVLCPSGARLQRLDACKRGSRRPNTLPMTSSIVSLLASQTSASCLAESLHYRIRQSRPAYLC